MVGQAGRQIEVSSGYGSVGVSPVVRSTRTGAAAIACVAVVGIGLSLSIPLLSLEMERMGLSNTWIGVNTAIAGVASIVVLPFVPRLAAQVEIGRASCRERV